VPGELGAEPGRQAEVGAALAVVEAASLEGLEATVTENSFVENESPGVSGHFFSELPTRRN
jgi:hypothetical protein